jgi:hypothetical protein
MTAGIQIINNSGQYQVIQDGLNYCFKYKTSFIATPTTTSGSDFRNANDVTIRISGSQRSILSYKTNGVYIVGNFDPTSYSGGSMNLNISYINLTGGNQTVEIFIFDRIFDRTNFGMEIYDSSGNVTMTTASRPLRIAGYAKPGYSFIVNNFGSYLYDTMNPFFLRNGGSDVELSKQWVFDNVQRFAPTLYLFVDNDGI